MAEGGRQSTEAGGRRAEDGSAEHGFRPQDSDLGLPAPGLRLPFRIRLVPVTPYRANVGFARLRSHRVFGRNLERLALADAAERGRPDRIVASWPPVESGEVAVSLGREWGRPVTLDVQDAWPEAFAAFIPGPAWLGRLALAPWRRRARAVFSSVERVSGVGRAFLDHARELGAMGPTHLTYLGAWFAAGEDGGRRPREWRTGEPLRLLYLGNVGRSQDLDTVVAGLALARARGLDARLEVAGGGERWAALERTVVAWGVGDAVRLHGFLTGADLDALEARAHVGINPVRAQSLIACPNKVADYLAAGLPILNSLPGELAELLVKHGSGRGFRAGEPETFAEALAAWAREPESVEVMSRGARRLGELCFSREKTYPDLARFVVGETLPPKT